MITFGKTVFLTTTYSRDRLLDSCWRTCGTDFNRYIQELRRIHQNQIQYIRCVEKHSDDYPHLHAVLRFPSVLTITNGRYFNRDVYKSWKKAWKHGHHDAQPPRIRQSSIAYIIKYTTKESGHKIWKKYYQLLNAPYAGSQATSCKTPVMAPSVHPVSPLSTICTKYKIKQITWSRKFFESLLTP